MLGVTMEMQSTQSLYCSISDVYNTIWLIMVRKRKVVVSTERVKVDNCHGCDLCIP